MNELSNPDLIGVRTPAGHDSNDILTWSLRPWWRAAVVLTTLVVVSVWLSVVGIRAAWSAYRLDSVSINDIQAALDRDPDNPDLAHRLGLVYTYDQTNLDTSDSLKYLRKAVELNPRRWEFWADLGTSCDFVGDTACSDEAFGRAWPLNPMGPTLGWAMGNHFLLTNRPEKAFPFFRALLGLSRDYLEPTFRLCLRATHNPQQIYSEVLPHDKDPIDRLTFLTFLVSTGDYSNAMKIWAQMLAGPDRSPKLPLVKPFLDFLTDHDRLEEATTVWNDLKQAGVVPSSPAADAGNLLYNGGFEGPPLNTGFGWRVSNSPELVYTFPETSGCRSNSCVRVDFSVGRNANYELLTQLVPVKPNTSYQLTGYVRSEDLTSDSGPRLRVTEVGCDNCALVTSDSTQSTTAWHPVGLSFLTQKTTQAVRVSFWRPQASAALGDITGTVWLDDVDLHAAEPAGPGVNPGRSR